MPVLPAISNFDDLDPLRHEPGLEVILATPGRPLPAADLILLPGSKATIADLLALLVLVSIPFSFAAGYGLSWFLAQGMQSDLYRVPVVLPPSAFAFAALVTVVSAVLSSLAVYWRIRQLDMIGVLKTRE